MNSNNVSMRIAGETAKAMPMKIKFTARSLEALRPPAEPDGRLGVYDTTTPGLAFLLTGRGAKSFYLNRRVLGKPSRVRLGDAELTVDQARDKIASLNAEIVKGVDVTVVMINAPRCSQTSWSKAGEAWLSKGSSAPGGSSISTRSTMPEAVAGDTARRR